MRIITDSGDALKPRTDTDEHGSDGAGVAITRNLVRVYPGPFGPE